MTIRGLTEAAVFSANVQPPLEEALLDISFDADVFFQDPLDILEFLSGLVVCRPSHYGESGNSDYTKPGLLESPTQVFVNSNIILSHFSIKEYLVSGRLRPEVQAFAMDEDSAHEVLAKKCLYSMLFFLAAYSGKTQNDIRHSHPFYAYAAERWEEHASAVDYESEFTHLIVTILEEQKLRSPFLKRFAYSDQFSDTLEPLYLATYANLYWPCKKLLDSGADASKQGGYYGSALQVASVNGSGTIAQLLLNHGVNVNMEGGNYGSALQAVSVFGDITIVQLLIDHEADINIEGGFYESALQAASVSGSGTIVQLLLAYGADVNMKGGFYRSALQGASACGSESIVQLLLNRGANPNLRGGKYGSALQVVVSKGSKLIIQPLLAHGAELNTKPGFYDGNIKNMFHYNNTDAVVLLLEHGAVMYGFLGGIEAKEALERKDFKRFVAIQVEKLQARLNLVGRVGFYGGLRAY
jgi:ankyrin repeat protein